MVSVYSSHEIRSKLLSLIESAKSDILAVVNDFNDPIIFNALIQALSSDIKIRLIILDDEENPSREFDYFDLQDNGAELFIGNNVTFGKNVQDFAIFDSDILLLNALWTTSSRVNQFLNATCFNSEPNAISKYSMLFEQIINPVKLESISNDVIADIKEITLDNIQIFIDNALYGIRMSSNEKLICPPRFDLIEVDNNHVKVKYNGANIIFDKNVENIVSLIDLKIKDFKEGLANIYAGGKWGCVDIAGNIIIDLKYDYEFHFLESGLATVQENNKYGLIDKSGKLIAPTKYDYLSCSYSNPSFFNVTLDTKNGLIDKFGKEVIPFIYDTVSIQPSFILVILNNKYGTFDFNGKELCSARFDFISGYDYRLEKVNFQRGITAVRIDNQWGAINDKGTEIIPVKYENVYTEYTDCAFVKTGGKLGIFNISESVSNSAISIISQKLYDKIIVFNNNYKCVIADKKMGFLDEFCKEITPLKYDYLNQEYSFDSKNILEKSHFSPDEFRVNLNNKVGYIDKSGMEIILPVYDAIIPFSTNYFKVTLDNKFGIIDKSGCILIDPVYDAIEASTNSSFQEMSKVHKICKNGKWGLIDENCKVIHPAIYDKIELNQFSHSKVLLKGKIGMIDNAGNEIIPPNFEDVVFAMFSQYAHVKLDSKWALFDIISQNVISSFYDSIIYSSFSVRIVQIRNKYVFLNAQGEEILQCMCDRKDISSIGGGFIKIKYGDKYDLINDEGKNITPIKFDSIDLMIDNNSKKSSVIKVQLNDRFGIINKQGIELIPIKFESIDFLGNSLKVKLKGKCGIYSTDGTILIPVIYDSININNGYYIVTSGNKKGIIDLIGSEIVPPAYDSINESLFSDGSAELRNGDKIVFLDKTGTDILKFSYDSCQIFSGHSLTKPSYYNTIIKTNFIKVFSNQLYGIYDKLGNEIFPVLYQDIEFYECGIRNSFFLLKKNGKFGVYNSLGKEIIELKFDSCIIQNDGYIFVGADNCFGLYSYSGLLIVPVLYQSIIPFKNPQYNSSINHFKVKSNDKWGVLDDLANTLLPLIYDDAVSFIQTNSGMYSIIKKGGKTGMIDYKYIEIFKTVFDQIILFRNEKHCIVSNDGKHGIASNNGNIELPVSYDIIGYNSYYESNYHEGTLFGGNFNYVQIQIGDKNGCIFYDSNINQFSVVQPKYDQVKPIYDQPFLVVNLADKWGIVNFRGEVVVPIAYEYLCDKVRYGDGIFIFFENYDEYQYYLDIHSGGIFVLLDETYSVIVPSGFKSIKRIKSNRLHVRNIDYLHGLIDNSGKQIISCSYDEIRFIGENMYAASKNKLFGIIDNSGFIRSRFKYDTISDFVDGFAKVVSNQKCGLINRQGREIIKLIFDHCGTFKEGYAPVKLKGLWGFIDTSGQIAVPCKYTKLTRFNSKGLSKFLLGSKKGYVNVQGIEIEYKEILNNEVDVNYGPRNEEEDNSGPSAYGYKSWDEMNLYEAFDGDIDAYNAWND